MMDRKFPSYYATLPPDRKAVLIARAKAWAAANRERRREIVRLSDHKRCARLRAERLKLPVRVKRSEHELKAAAVARAKAWAQANPEKVREHARLKRLRHPDAHAARSRRSEVKRTPEQRALKWKRWYENNRPRLAEKNRRRHHRVGQATPGWANKDAILAVYELAARMTRETGVPHQVDHIVPLKGRNMCGLHVENNLQVLTKAANVSKGNRFAT